MCACIWQKLPADGWERTPSEKIVTGEEPGCRGEAFSERFRSALKECGGFELKELFFAI